MVKVNLKLSNTFTTQNLIILNIITLILIFMIQKEKDFKILLEIESLLK